MISAATGSNMKIVVATFTFHPEVDGVAMAAGLMVANFVSAGHEVHVATGPSKSVADIGNFRGFEVHRFESPGKIKSSKANGYVDFLTKANADVIVFHCWNSWPTDMALQSFDRIPGKKVMLSHGYDTHSIHWQKKFPWGLVAWIKRLPKALALPQDLKAFDRVVFLSSKKDTERFFDAWLAARIVPEKVRIIPNSIERQGNTNSLDFQEIHGIGSGFIFLCVANYSIRKNQGLALEAYCKANIRGSSLIFIGSSLGAYGTRIKEEWTSIRGQHPDLSVYFFENLDREDVLAAFKSCDVVVLSATAETQPIVLLEAMASGKPFISTDTGCVSEFEGGLIAHDVHTMSMQMRELAFSSEKSAALSAQGLAYFSLHHTPGVVNRAWNDLVIEVAHP